MESGHFPNCRPNPSAVIVNCVHTADATKQFRRVGVGGVYWAKLFNLGRRPDRFDSAIDHMR